MRRELLLEIANEFGTPTYVYDADKIENQYNKLHNAFSPLDVKLHYALKALSNVNILRVLKNKGAGLDAVSINEVHLGIRAGFQPQQIMFTPNCVSFDEYQEAIELGVTINIDNLNEVEDGFKVVYQEFDNDELPYKKRMEYINR